MWNKTKTDVREMVLNIETASDKIVERLEITDVSVNALRMLKEDIAVIRSATDETLSDYSDVLLRIQEYINKAVKNPDSFELYAERVHDHVRSYLLESNKFDADYEAGKDKAMEGRIKIKGITTEIEETEKRIKAIEEEWIINNYPTDSARYMALVSEHSGLLSGLKDKKSELSKLHRMNKANVSISSAVERRRSTESAMAGITMGADEYSDLVMENKELEGELFAELEAIDRIAGEVSDSPFMAEIDDTDFRRAIEETLLERLYRSDAKDYEDSVKAMPKDELNVAMLQVMRKITDLEGLIKDLRGEQKRQAERNQAQLDELLANTAYLSALRGDTTGDIVKEVEHHLSRNPADIQSAQLKIRACIELYCRFKKGIKLTDGLLFSPGEKVKQKFASSKPAAHDDELAGIYSSTNAFIHNENRLIIMSDAERKKNAEIIRENARKLHEWGVDQYDLTDGIKNYYVTRDEMLLKMLEDGRIDKNFVERESGSDDKLTRFFSDGRKLEKDLQALYVRIPEIRFKSLDDVKAYLDKADDTAKAYTEPKPQPVKTEVAKPVSPIGKQKPGRESVIMKYNPESKYGFIRNPDRPQDKKGIYFQVKGDDKGFVIGARVSFVMGRNYNGPCADEVQLVASAEVTD